MINLPLLKIGAVFVTVATIASAGIAVRLTTNWHEAKARKEQARQHAAVMTELETELAKKQQALDAEVERARIRAEDLSTARLAYAALKRKLDDAPPLSDPCTQCRIPAERMRILRSAASANAPPKDRGTGEKAEPAKR